MEEEFGKALREVGSIVMKNSKADTPVDTGALRASHRLSGPEGSKTMMSVSVTVGGPSALYATYVHEDLNAKHPKGGHAKFLENAVMSLKPIFPVMLADAIRKATK